MELSGDEKRIQALFSELRIADERIAPRFNTFMNDIFQKELSGSPKIQPLTAMSINNLEELLPYVSENAFGWTELLQSRFLSKEVGTFSVHQAIYDLARSKGLPPLRNQAIRNKFDQVWSIIKSRYKPTEAE